jgi:sulfoxide reductase heme-binding subunit YedZ
MAFAGTGAGARDFPLSRTPPRYRLLVWTLLAAPGLWWTVAYASGRGYYGEYLHATGHLGAQLVVAALLVTPLTRCIPPGPQATWLKRCRRYLGVAAFAYAAMHTLAYCLRQPAPRIAEEAASLPVGSGWVAFAILLVLAATSNDWSVRRLGRRWKTLHRSTYAAAALTFAHWALTAFDPSGAIAWLLLLVVMEALRLLPERRR